MLSYSQVSTPVSEDEALDEILGLLQMAGFNATSWGSGSLQRKFVRYSAKIYSDVTKYAGAVAAMGFNDTSSGEALTRFSKSHYDNTRNPATKTSGTFRLVNSGAVLYTISSTTVVVAYQEPDGTQRTFRNTTFGTVPVGGYVDLTFEAETAGSAWNIPTSATLLLVTPMAGVTAQNPAISGYDTWMLSAGTDEESDERLRLRNSTKWATLSIERPSDAIVNFALMASTKVTRVGVDDANRDGPFTFRVYIAGDVAGAIGLEDIDAVTNYIGARLLDKSTMMVLAAPSQAIDLYGTVWFDPSYSAGSVQAAVERALTAYISAAPLGGFDYDTGLSHVVRINDLESEIKNAAIGSSRPVQTVTLTDASGGVAEDVSVSSFGILKRGTWSLTYKPVKRAAT
jgi:hypothetical protein